MSGKRTLEECKAINALGKFNKAKCYGRYENVELGIVYDYKEYTHWVRKELERDKGNEYNGLMQCSNNEVEAASEIAAKKWCDYMEGK